MCLRRGRDEFPTRVYEKTQVCAQQATCLNTGTHQSRKIKKKNTEL